MSSHANRSSSLNAMRSRLGHAASIGGRDQVMREIVSGRFAATFASDRNTADQATQIIDSLLRKAPEKSPHKVPTGKQADRERVKVRWSADVIARFRKLAPKIEDNAKLAVAMGFPACCEGSMKRARTRHLLRVVATAETPRNRPGESLAGALRQAA